MAESLRFHPLVASDLADAIAWYEKRAVGLGERFRLLVDARFDDILSAPELSPRAFKGLEVRFARLHRFPYLILYRMHGATVDVLGVLHSASDPNKWRRRLANGFDN